MDEINVKVDDFNVSKITLHVRNERSYKVKYEGKEFKLLTNCVFRTLGYKDVSNIKKIILTFDEEITQHEKVKRIINEIYLKTCNYFKESKGMKNIENIHPLGPHTYSLDLEVKKSTTLYEIDGTNVINFNLNEIEPNERFTLLPIVKIDKINVHGSKSYFNYALTEGYVKFQKMTYRKDEVISIFNEFESLQ